VDYTLNDEQQLLDDNVRRYVADRLKPRDRQERQDHESVRGIIKECGELGLLGVRIPEALGGSGFGTLEMSLIVQGLATSDPGLALMVLEHACLCGAALQIADHGIDKISLLNDIASGTKIAAWAWPNFWGDSQDAPMIDATCQSETWTLNGMCPRTFSGRCADMWVVGVRPTHDLNTPQGFLVDKSDKGLRFESGESPLGMQNVDWGSLHCSSMSLSDNHNLCFSSVDKASYVALFGDYQIGLASLALGIAEAAYLESLAYAQQRKQFGKAIAQFQAIQFKIADMKTRFETSRLLLHRASWKNDQGQPSPKEISMAQVAAIESAVLICDEAVQIHGGNGYSEDFPVASLYRDAQFLQLYVSPHHIERSKIANAVLQWD
jgi:alkylation response protein AidB-like acyl-CoA dehydrogenase